MDILEYGEQKPYVGKCSVCGTRFDASKEEIKRFTWNKLFIFNLCECPICKELTKMINKKDYYNND